MKLHKLYFLSTIFFMQLYGISQTPPTKDSSNVIFSSSGKSIEGDKRIEALEKRFTTINADDKKINGYRIQLFSSPGPESFSKANEVQAEFLQIYPDIDSYVLHIGASFKLRIGDYRNRMEAERFYVELKENFPDAFIVRDRINFPVLAIEKTEEH